MVGKKFHWVYHVPHFLHPFLHWWTPGLVYLATVGSAAINIDGQASLWSVNVELFRQIPWNGIALFYLFYSIPPIQVLGFVLAPCCSFCYYSSLMWLDIRYGVVLPLFFSLSIALASQGLLHFCTNFKILFSISGLVSLEFWWQLYQICRLLLDLWPLSRY
jgi:hypothetical protein